MEKCVFCGNTRKSAPLIRFFAVPREPGLKRIQWLYALGDKEMGPKDRVCGLHFRQGRPSSDPSHEDFVPHLYLNRDPPEEILSYLESLDDSKNDDTAGVLNVNSTTGNSILTNSYSNSTATVNTPTETINTDSHSQTSSLQPEKSLKITKPSILQRKRKCKSPKYLKEEHPNLMEKCWNGEGPSPSKVHILHRSVAEAVGAKHGQRVIVRRFVPVVRKQKKLVELGVDLTSRNVSLGENICEKAVTAI